jgi:diguanylate cyclase (GGDEF)-like protein/PAS domain S-box-containing protein
MIVDNDSVAAGGLQASLEKLGYVVAQASCEAEAMRLTGEQKPELVLMNIHLENRNDGLRVAEQMRAQYGLPVILTGSQADVAALEQAQPAEPDGYILTPFEERELDSIISLALYKHDSRRKLHESEAQVRKLSQAVIQSADNIIITDTEGAIEFVNPQFEKTTGYSLAEVFGKNPRILKSGEQSNEYYHQMWQTIKSGQVWRGELHNKRRDGSLYWEEVSIAPVVDESGAVTNFVAIKKEITERKALEQNLRIKESAISSSINAIALADLDGRLTYVNPALLRLWGYTRAEEILGKSIGDFWEEEPPLDSITNLLSHGRGWQGEMTARRKDGSLLEVDVSAHMVKDSAGRPLCMMSSFVDITARKQAEAAEREERLLTEALRLTAEALGSSLKLDDVLELILENAGRVIANDSMTIMLLEGESLKVVRHRGYTERGLKDYIENTEFKIDDFPSLRLMIETRQPSIIPDVRGTPLWSEQTRMEWIRSYAGVPIIRREQVIGFLNLDSATPNFFTPAHANRLKAFASQAAVAIENARLYEQDHILSITDGLTGLYNSRYFFELAKLEFERSHRYHNSLSVVMIDVDYFKQVNDTFGHLVGDDVLREIARRVRTCLRVVDIAARYGGEEFVVLMAQTGEAEAWQAAERMRCAVADVPFEMPEGQLVSITISLGVTTLVQAHHNLNMLVKSADDALYTAKYAGRNRIAVWKNPE